jgi:hypothetical protein
MGNYIYTYFFPKKKEDEIYYESMLDTNIYMIVKRTEKGIQEGIKIIDNSKIYEGFLLYCNIINPYRIIFIFSNKITLCVYKEGEYYYKLNYNFEVIEKELLEYKPILFLSENIDKIYEIQNNHIDLV